MGFDLPTSEQMSADIGASVFAYQPADFPNYDALVQGEITPSQLDERAQEILRAWTAFSPEIEGNDKVAQNVLDLARGYTPEINGFVDEDTGTPYFAMTLPSSTLSEADFFAMGTGMRIDGSQGNIPAKHRAYISVQHELGHAAGFMQGRGFARLYDEEVYAEGYALDQYIQAGGSMDVVKEVIDTRALEAFFVQDDAYWIAPALSNRFFGSAFDDRYDGARETHHALRAYVVNRLLDEKDSRHIDEAIADGVLVKSDLREVLSSLYDAARDQREDEQVKWLAQMVLDGAYAHVPELLPVNHRQGSGCYTRDDDAYSAELMFV